MGNFVRFSIQDAFGGFSNLTIDTNNALHFLVIFIYYTN